MELFIRPFTPIHPYIPTHFSLYFFTKYILLIQNVTRHVPTSLSNPGRGRLGMRSGGPSLNQPPPPQKLHKWWSNEWLWAQCHFMRGEYGVGSCFFFTIISYLYVFLFIFIGFDKWLELGKLKESRGTTLHLQLCPKNRVAADIDDSCFFLYHVRLSGGGSGFGDLTLCLKVRFSHYPLGLSHQFRERWILGHACLIDHSTYLLFGRVSKHEND